MSHSMQYHVLLIGLLEPFLGLDTTPGEINIEAIISQSKARFEALIRIYYLRHGFESYDPALFHFLHLLAYSALKDMQRTDRGSRQHELIRSTLVLCARGLWDQGRCYYAAEAVLHLLMESVGSEDAILIRKFTGIDESNEYLNHMTQEIRSQWPIGAFSFPKEGQYRTLGHFIHWWEASQVEKWKVQA